MTYLFRTPSPPLNAYIDDLYFMSGSALSPRLKVFPMPCIHLMVNFGDAFRIYGADQAKPFATCTESWSLGLWSTYHVVEWPPNVKFFGIHFKPGGAYPFLRVPLDELHNQVVPLEAISGKDASELRERLAAAPTVQAGFDLLECVLLARLRETPESLKLVQAAIGEIDLHHGGLTVRALCDNIGISQSYLDAQFKRIVGIAPKALARFYRFVQVLRSVDPAQPVDWTRIAHEACFYDQSHFNKDFVAFTSYSPTEYLRLRRRLHAQNPERAQLLGQLPIE